MCLGAPGQVVSIEGTTAVVDFWGVRRVVGLDLADEPVVPGDYVLVHVGFVIRRIAPDDLAETMAFFESMSGEELEGLAPPSAPSLPREKAP